MSDFEIRTGVPIPAGHTRVRIEYPIASLQVGQCIVVAATKRTGLSAKLKAFAAEHPGWRFAGRFINNKTEYAFWCLERSDASAPTPPLSTIRREAETSTKPSSTTAHQQKLREAAKLQPAGKARQHVAR